MAKGTHKAIVEIDAKVSKADAKIGKLEKQVGKLTSQLGKAGKESAKAKEKFDAMGATMDKVKLAMGAVGMAGAAIGAVKAIDELVTSSVKLQSIQQNLPFSIDAARKATKNLVSDMELMKAAVAANRLGTAKTSEEFARMSGAAVKLSLSVGGDATTAVGEMNEAIGKGSTEVLNNFGIIMTKAEIDALGMAGAIDKVVDKSKDLKIELGESTEAWIEAKSELGALADDVLPAITEGLATSVRWIREMGDGFAYAALRVSGYSSEVLNMPVQATRGGAIFGGSGQDRQAEERGRASAQVRIDRAMAQAAENIKADDEFIFAQIEAEGKRLQGLNLGKKKGRGGRRKKQSVKPGDRFGGVGDDLQGLDLGGAQRGVQADALELENELREQNLALKEQEIVMAGDEADIHAIRMEAITASYDAEIEMAELRSESHEAQVLGIQKEMELRSEQGRHEQELAKDAEKREKAKLQQRAGIERATMGLMSSTAGFAEVVAEKTGASEQKVARITAVARGVEAMAKGAQTVAAGVADVASQNYVKGAMEIAAGLMNLTVGGMLMTGDIAGAAGAAGGGAGGGGGGGFAGGGGSPRSFSQGPSSNIPSSPNSPQPQNTGGGSGGGNTTNIGTINVTGTIDEETSFKIKQGLEELDYSRGNVSA